MNYGEKLKDLRKYNGLSQAYIADKLGIKRSSYNQFEHQYDIVPIKRLNDLANIFECSIDYILGLNDLKFYTRVKDKINMNISKERLKNFRKEQKLTQVQLANFLKTSQSVVTGFENGRNFISTSFLYDICKKYNISADYLLGKIDEPKYLQNQNNNT